jgi:hypothetical protein
MADKKNVIKREAAKRDLTQHFVYLAQHASLASPPYQT